MDINVATIPPHGKSIDLSLHDDWVRQAFLLATDGECLSLDGNIDLQRHGTRITVTVVIAAVCLLECGRCLSQVQVTISGTQNLVYEPDVANPAPGATSFKQLKKIKEEIELFEDDMNVGWYNDGKLSLEQVLCEAGTLICPNRVFCNTDGVTRTKEGKCVTFKGDDEPLVYNPFANLDDM